MNYPFGVRPSAGSNRLKAGMPAKSKSLWCVSIVTTREAEDAVTELLGTMLGEPASSYFDLETGVATIRVYCQAKSFLKTAWRENLSVGLDWIKRCGLNLGSGKIILARVRRQSWAESWKRHFKPIEIGDALLVKPSWSKKRPRKNQEVVILDPGLSFGTGQHPTTAFCLHEVAQCGKKRTRWSFLDIGTGSGILAIAAAKLGFSPVHAFDFDPDSVRIARANARTNGVQNRLRIMRQDVTKLPYRPPKQYDLICANLISTLLIAERQRIVAHLKPGGRLVLAGILKSEFSGVRKVFTKLGLKVAAVGTGKEWRSGAFSAV